MTYAPPTIVELGRYWTAHGGVNLGIVGDTRHAAKGRSYHLGKSQLTADAYSRQTARDRTGLSEAASAIDLGALRVGTMTGLVELRHFSKWFVERCRTNAPGTSDVREFIYSPDGKTVLRWDRERGVQSTPRPNEADASHLGHSHISFYRDSERRPKVGLVSPYFTPKPATAPRQEAPVADTEAQVRLSDAITKRAGYLANEVKAGDDAGILTQAAKIADFSTRIVVSIAGAQASTDDYFVDLGDGGDVVYLTGGSPGNPNGATFTLSDARKWWEIVFGQGLNISRVRPTLLPGSKVLSPEGYDAAVALGQTSTTFAPEDFNPLGLEIHP